MQDLQTPISGDLQISYKILILLDLKRSHIRFTRTHMLVEIYKDLQRIFFLHELGQ